MHQSGFADLAYTHKKKTTRKERFLAEMAQLLPWPALLKPIVKRYPNCASFGIFWRRMP